MGIGDALGYGLSLIRRQPKILVPVLIQLAMLVALGGLVYLSLSSMLKGGALSLLSLTSMTSVFAALAGALIVLVVGVIIYYLISVLLIAMFIDLARQGYSGNISLGNAFKVAKKRYAAFFAAGILAAIIIGILQFVLQIIITYAASSVAFLGGLIALVVSVVFFVVVFLFYEISVAVVIENNGPIDAIKRSIEIVKMHFLELIAILVVVAIIGYGFLVGLPGIIFLLSPTALIIPAVIVFVILLLFLTTWSMSLPVAYYHNYVKSLGNSSGTFGKGVGIWLALIVVSIILVGIAAYLLITSPGTSGILSMLSQYANMNTNPYNNYNYTTIPYNYSYYNYSYTSNPSASSSSGSSCNGFTISETAFSGYNNETCTWTGGTLDVWLGGGDGGAIGFTILASNGTQMFHQVSNARCVSTGYAGTVNLPAGTYTLRDHAGVGGGLCGPSVAVLNTTV